MKQVLTALALTGLLAAAGCSKERVLGYCGQGDTCRYDLSEPQLVRTYSGFIQPKPVEVADVEASKSTKESAPAIAPAQAGASATLVSISN